MTDRTVRLGIIGLGAQGGYYAGFLSKGRVPNIVLAAICDTDESKRAVAQGYGVPFFTDYISMLDSGEVDAVVTTIPHFLHPEVAIAALDHGVHVLVEKPIGVYTKQARTLLDHAATKPELTTAVMFNQRTNPLYIYLRNLIHGGELGKLRHTNWIITTWWRPQGYYDQSAWRATWGGEGGGVLVNQAPHQLDLWQWLCGVPTSVFAKCAFGFKRDIAVEDEVTALVDFGDGATGTFTTCTHDLTGTDRLEILLDGGKIVVDDSTTVTITRLSAPEQQISAELGMDEVRGLFTGQTDVSTYASTSTRTYDSPWTDQHPAVLQNFAAHILDGEPLVAPVEDGMHGVRLANAIHLSAWTGEEVSITDFDEDRYLRELNQRIAQEGAFTLREEGADMATIGVQLMMVRDEIATRGMYPVLQRIADLGYRSVEVSQVPTDEANVAALERAGRELDLRVAALSVGLKKGPTTTGDALDADFDKIVADCRRLDCRFTRIGMMPFEAMVSKDAVIGFARDAEQAAQRLAEAGITLAYHNHHVDFAKHDGETLFDIVRRVSPTLHYEIDVHWVQRGGRDPVAVLREFAGSVELVHLKDYRVATLPESGLELLKAGDFAGFMQEFSNLVQFAEVGQGTLDFAAVIQQALAGGAEHLLVEQDELYGRNPFDCLADSINHIRSLGY